MKKLFGTDGIRGIAGIDLDAILAVKVGMALGEIINNNCSPTVIIGMDTRESSDMLASAISAGLCSVGCTVRDIGVCSTPAVAFLVKKIGAMAGIMISASHNPYNYNGIKIFGSDGCKLPDDVENRIEQLLFNGIKTSSKRIGYILKNTELIESYLDYLSSSFDIRLDGMKVAIDCANGSTCTTAERLFSGLGAQCHIIANSPNGLNINKNCGSTSTNALKKAMILNECDVGIAFDGDGDRCIAIDRLGREIDGDYIMAILAMKLKNEGRLTKNTVVGTVMSNLGLRKFCEEMSINFVASAVGDRYVLETMQNEGYSFGGEQSGHIILGELATTGDGQLTAIALLSHIKESGKDLHTLASYMKKYPQYTVNIDSTSEQKALLRSSAEIDDIIKNAEKSLGNTGRILVRASGTEPLIRIMVESEQDSKAKEICYKTAEKIRCALA